MFSCIMLYFWQIGIFWEKILSLQVSINSTWYEKVYLNFLKILCMSLQKFWNIIREFMRNSRMQVKRITHLPLAVRGHFCIFGGNKSSNLSSPPSIFQLPEIVAIEIITIWMSSSQNNPLWKRNQIMFKKFPSEPVFLYNIFFFFVLHFLVSKIGYVILVLEGNGLVFLISGSTFLAQKVAQTLSGCNVEQVKQQGWVLHGNTNLLKSRFLTGCSNIFNQNKIAG